MRKRETMSIPTPMMYLWTSSALWGVVVVVEEEEEGRERVASITPMDTRRTEETWISEYRFLSTR